MFFFEKKNQKTFTNLGTRCGNARPNKQKFFGSFFQKRTAFFLLLLPYAAQAEPALWLAQSPTAKVYLFGTMHILPKQVDWFGPHIATAFAASSTLWEEADVGLKDPAIVAQIMAQATAPDYDLWSALPAAYADKFKSQLHGCGMSPVMVAHVRPWMASVMVSMCQLLGHGAAPQAASGPEGILLDRAKDAGKTVRYFETAEQQLHDLSDAPQAAQIAQLKQAIDEAHNGAAEFATMETAWATGNVAAIAATVAQSRREDRSFYETVFPIRNKHFASRIADMLHGSGTTFVAIGAGHLAGDDSVQHFLAQQGVHVTRVE